MQLAILLVLALALMFVGVPIGISLAIGMMTVAFTFGTTSLTFIVQNMYTGLDSLPLLAVPCFMLAGSLMETGGLSRRLVNVARAMVGHITGGLSVAVIITCFFFGAISGSAPATVAAVGTIMLPYLAEAGYDKVYSTGLIAVAGGLGIIVPPSIPMIVYGVATNTSIGDLFKGGWGPGVVVAVLLSAVAIYRAKKHGYTGTDHFAGLKEVGKAIWDAKWAILMPVIILGGIYGGVFTPTEAAVVAVIYSVVVGLFVHRELTLKDIFKIFDNNTSFVGGLMLVFAPAGAMGGVLAMMGVPALIRDFLLGISDNIYVIMIIVNIFLLFVGMILDTMSAIVIFAPILMQVLVPMGIHPVHLGLIMVLNLAVGFVTPPVAQNLFVASSMTKIPIDKIVRSAWPFIIAMIIATLIITYVPGISLLLVG